MKEFKGELQGFPEEVVNWMLYQQEKQGNKRDISVFEENQLTSRHGGGFNWDETEEGKDFCEQVIFFENFNLFFEKYPKVEVTTKTDSVSLVSESKPKMRYFIVFFAFTLFDRTNFDYSQIESIKYPNQIEIENDIIDVLGEEVRPTITNIIELTEQDYNDFIK